MAHLWIIVNPAAASGRALARWRRFERLLRREGIGYQRCLTLGPGHATDLARVAAEERAERIAVFGGDGTLHEVVQTVAGANVPLVFLPAGSSCDFAKELPPRPLLERLQSRRLLARDLIRIECAGLDGGRVERYAVNGSNVGIVSDAAQRLNSSPLRGWSVNVAAVAAGVAAYRAFSPLDFALRYDERPVRARLVNLTVLKTNWLCGLMRFGVPVSGDDGQMIAVDAAPAPLPGLLSALYRGKVIDHPAVGWRRCAAVRVCEPAGVLVEADGEIVGRPPVAYSVWPKALRVAI